MSQKAPTKAAWVYQPDPPSKKTERIYAVGGLPLRMTKEEAEAIAGAINSITWISDECRLCRHRARFPSSACPSCNAETLAPWVEVPPCEPCPCGCTEDEGS